MDVLAALRLQLEWGADEALLADKQDRRQPVTPIQPIHAAALPAAKPTAKPTAKPATMPAGPTEALALATQAANACTTLAQLRDALSAFTGCSLRDTATQLVFADGAEDAKLLLIGEAPGAEEDRAGKPFVGPAGQLLDKMLASIGLDRSTLRIVNTVPWRPPGNRTPTESEIAVCLPFLHRHIVLMAPDHIVLLGNIAAKAMLPPQLSHSGIRRLRGAWQQVELPGLARPIACLPTYHPAYLLRLTAAKRESWHDFIALRDALHG